MVESGICKVNKNRINHKRLNINIDTEKTPLLIIQNDVTGTGIRVTKRLIFVYRTQFKLFNRNNKTSRRIYDVIRSI